MKFPFFASFIVFCIWLAYELHKQRKKEANAKEIFWEKEVEANNTHRKSLDDLAYIKIPLDTLPMETSKDDPAIMECQETLRELSAFPIVNFTGISNTDLKLMYGAPNITLLSEYDQRYTLLACTLQKWADALCQKGCPDDACTVLEFAVSTRTDISASYKLLASIYMEKGQPEKIKNLLPIAESLNSSLSGHIVRMLEETIK